MAVVAVMNAMLVKPSTATIGRVTATFGAAAMTSIVRPKPAAPTTTSWIRTVRRSATTNAPRRAPALKTAYTSV